jgi:hypothetical protein
MILALLALSIEEQADDRGQVQMRFKRVFLLLFVLVSMSDVAFAQQTPAKTDSTQLYRNIESYSKRSRLTRFMHRLIFKPVAPDPSNKKAKKNIYKKLIQKPYSAFEGKIIRNIDIVTLDPFGYSATDTTVAPRNFLFRAGNGIHAKTRSITIRNLLLIRENQPFNSLRARESERLIRNQKYVHEVSFYVVTAGARSDSVDVFIRELNKWSIIPTGSISSSGFKVEIADNNILGLGHEFRNVFARNTTDKINSFNTDYSVPNIHNTYISTKVHFGVDGYKNSATSVAVDRPFFSPLAKWAAGVSLASQIERDSLKDMNSVYVPMSLKYRTQDYWAGKAQRLFKGNTEDDRVTNLIMAVRYLRIRYYEKPSERYDSLHVYSNEDFYLAALGLSTRKYVQDKYVFKYGVVEDVPIGVVYALTGGYQVRNDFGRPYLGVQVFFGNYNEWGYLSSDFEYGTFFHASHAEQGVITLGANYFTGLFEIGKWKFRQFVKPQVTIGLSRFPSDSLTLNAGYGLDGFNSSSLSGTDRLLFTLQTQIYAPWKLIGFHFGPYLTCSLGMLSDAVTGFKNSRVYSQMGVLIKNEHLVFSSFQLSISFYPSIPGSGQDVFKMNAFKTTDFGFRDFEIQRPGTIAYQ